MHKLITIVLIFQIQKVGDKNLFKRQIKLSEFRYVYLFQVNMIAAENRET